jgi:hypothetical protein
MSLQHQPPALAEPDAAILIMNCSDARRNRRTEHQAPPIFGGHKAEAVKLIESAINEIEAAKALAP